MEFLRKGSLITYCQELMTMKLVSLILFPYVNITLTCLLEDYLNDIPIKPIMGFISRFK